MCLQGLRFRGVRDLRVRDCRLNVEGLEIEGLKGGSNIILALAYALFDLITN